MRAVNLSDDQLWHAIAQNTNAISVLINQQYQSKADITAPNDVIRRAVNADTIGRLQRKYREYSDELRRRYDLDESSNNKTVLHMPCDDNVVRAAEPECKGGESHFVRSGLPKTGGALSDHGRIHQRAVALIRIIVAACKLGERTA